MKIYNFYRKTDNNSDLENSIIIEDKFSWQASVFNFAWFLYHKMWFASFLSFLLSILISLLFQKTIIDQTTYLCLNGFYMIIIGAFATNWHEIYLKSKSFVLDDVICAKNEEKALFKYLSRNLTDGN
jgi:hypothetical protein